MSPIVPTTSDPDHLTSSPALRTLGCGACALGHTRSPRSPAPLPGFGSCSGLLSNAPLHHHLPPPPATPTPAAPRPLPQGASAPGDHPDLPFSLCPRGPHLPASRVLQPLSHSRCPLTGILPNTMGARRERAAGARPVSPPCRQSGSAATPPPLLPPPRPQRGGKCSLDLGGLTAAARARRCRRAASRARARRRRGRGARRLLSPLSRRGGPGLAASRPRG